LLRHSHLKKPCTTFSDFSTLQSLHGSKSSWKIPETLHCKKPFFLWRDWGIG
jgi:hypothetical protein